MESFVEYRRIDEYTVRNDREQEMLRKLQVGMNVLNHTSLCCLHSNALHRDRRIMVHLQMNRQVNYTDRQGKSREIQLGINRRIEYGTKLAI